MRADGSQGCVARSWRCWPASAPITTCGSSRAATRIRRAQVLDALARALRLDVKATEYLHQLASPAGGRRDHAGAEVAADGTEELIEQFAMPAIVASRSLDVLAANRIARALSPGFAPGRNFLSWRLLDPAARELYVDWDEATDVAVSGLREAAGSDPDDPRVRSLID